MKKTTLEAALELRQALIALLEVAVVIPLNNLLRFIIKIDKNP